jgi:hypothetical protein
MAEIRPYLDRVQNCQTRFPALKSVVDFSNATHRHEARLAVLEFKEKRVEHKRIENVEMLKKYWAGQAGSEDDCRGRLYMLEDLSGPYIEALGDHFDIDPSLFAVHLYTPFWSKSKENQEHASVLVPAWRLNPTVYSLRYYEVRRFAKRAAIDWNSHNLTSANVMRPILTVNPECTCGFVLRNASFWVPSPNPGCWNGELYIMLTAAVHLSLIQYSLNTCRSNTR